MVTPSRLAFLKYLHSVTADTCNGLPPAPIHIRAPLVDEPQAVKQLHEPLEISGVLGIVQTGAELSKKFDVGLIKRPRRRRDRVKIIINLRLVGVFTELFRQRSHGRDPALLLIDHERRAAGAEKKGYISSVQRLSYGLADLIRPAFPVKS
ncbi:hypothetical protein [Bradyrhizobium liaoningense]